MRYARVAIVTALLFAPSLARAQYGDLTHLGLNNGGGTQEYHSSEYGKPFLAEQEAQKKREAAAAEVAARRDAEDREMREYYRKQELDKYKQYKIEHGDAGDTAPPQANAREAAERARLEQVAKQIEAARRASGSQKPPSAAFLATQARFNDPQRTQAKVGDSASTLTEAEKQAAPVSAEQERKRRFTPDGIVYNLKPIKVATQNRSAVIAAVTELTLVKKNEDGTVHVKWNGLEADVPANDVTNDRDWLAAYRNLNTDKER